MGTIAPTSVNQSKANLKSPMQSQQLKSGSILKNSVAKTSKVQ